MATSPIDYTSGNGFGQGLQLAGLYEQVQQQKVQAEQAKQQQETLKAFQTDWQSSYGDPEKMDALVAKYPGQIDTIKNAIGFRDDNHKMALGNAARDFRVALASNNPQAIQQAANRHAQTLESIGSSPQDVMEQFKNDPQGLAQTVDIVGMQALGNKDYYGVAGDRDKLAETIRSNQAGESLTARGQDITVRGQDISADTARRGQDMAMQRAIAKTMGVGGNRVVQLSDGRTVNVGGKLHGAGANAFYEGTDDNGNMVRVPASVIAAPPTSAASAQNYAMKKDIDAISGADPSKLNFMTGITGGVGDPAWYSEQRSRVRSVEERNLYTASRRIQGKMQNQGVAAARDMGASGINTVAEAKMYFQGMPQVDYSNPAAMQQSIRDIQEYTNNYNQQYQVNVGGSTAQQPAAQQPSGGNYTSKSGIQFTVK